MNRLLSVVRRGAFLLPVLGMFLSADLVPLSEASEVAGLDAGKSQVVRGNDGVGPDYHLGPGDTVEVEMFNQNAVGTTQRLTANGEVRLPLVGRVVLQGLTVREAEQHVENLYRDGGFFRDPQVIIAVNQYSSRSVHVLGQVRNPERVSLPPEANSIGIVEAITLAGGLTRIAKADSVQVTRTSADGSTRRFEVDVQELLTARRSDKPEFQLLPGDRVFVPERAF